MNHQGKQINHKKEHDESKTSTGQICTMCCLVASETQEYSSLDSNHSTEELSVQETAPDVFREPEEDEDPLLELLQTQSSFDTEQETGPDRPQQDRKRAIQRLSQAAERASSWLWLRREEMSWKQSTNAQ